MTREEKEKIIADCEHMSFDFELFGRPTKALCLDAVKNILDDISESESEIDDTTKNNITENCIACKYDEDDWATERCQRCLAGDSQFELDDALIEPTTKNDSRGECMNFPHTFDEFANEYGFKDKEEVYSNGGELIPVFRVKQWLEHIQEPRWIPVSERLPEKLTEVLIAFGDSESEFDVAYMRKTFNDAYKKQEVENEWVSCMGDTTYADFEVVAWMPIEPYKAESEEV